MSNGILNKAASRSGPRHISSQVNNGTTATTIDLSSYVNEYLYFSARTATIYVNFAATSAVTAATTAMFPIPVGTAEEFMISESTQFVSILANGSTGTMGYGYTSS